MQAVCTRTSLLRALALSTLIATLMTTQSHAMSRTKRRVAIIAPFTTALFLISENARTLATEAYNKSTIALLHLLQHCPLSENSQQEIANKIETLNTTRADSKFTSDRLRALFKDFKDLVDICKAGKDAYQWL